MLHWHCKNASHGCGYSITESDLVAYKSHWESWKPQWVPLSCSGKYLKCVRPDQIIITVILPHFIETTSLVITSIKRNVHSFVLKNRDNIVVVDVTMSKKSAGRQQSSPSYPLSTLIGKFPIWRWYLRLFNMQWAQIKYRLFRETNIDTSSDW